MTKRNHHRDEDIYGDYPALPESFLPDAVRERLGDAMDYEPDEEARERVANSWTTAALLRVDRDDALTDGEAT